MLPSAGQSHSALRVPAPVVYYCTPLMLWWLSSLMDSPNSLGFPTMDVCCHSMDFGTGFLLLLTYSHLPTTLRIFFIA